MTIRIEEGPGASGPCLPGSHEWEPLEYDGNWPERPYRCWRCATAVFIEPPENAAESWEWLEEWLVTNWLEAKYPAVFATPGTGRQAVDEPSR